MGGERKVMLIFPFFWLWLFEDLGYYTVHWICNLSFVFSVLRLELRSVFDLSFYLFESFENTLLCYQKPEIGNDGVVGMDMDYGIGHGYGQTDRNSL
jgi:hypothetical protein